MLIFLVNNNFKKVILSGNSTRNSEKTIQQKSSLLNHTIKNEAAKILLCTDNIKASINNESDGFKKYFNLIESSTNHLMDMVEKIGFTTSEIIVNPSYANISNLLDDCLKDFKNHMNSKNIKFIKTYSDNIVVYFDKTHTKEVLNNIFVNAIEAARSNGKIEVESVIEYKTVKIKIKDNGKGIEKECI